MKKLFAIPTENEKLCAHFGHCEVIISGGMGQKALDLFAQNNIEVCMGVDAAAPAQLVEKYLSDQLQTGQNQCDH